MGNQGGYKFMKNFGLMLGNIIRWSMYYLVMIVILLPIYLIAEWRY